MLTRRNVAIAAVLLVVLVLVAAFVVVPALNRNTSPQTKGTETEATQEAPNAIGMNALALGGGTPPYKGAVEATQEAPASVGINASACLTREEADDLLFDGEDVLVQIGTESVELQPGVTAGAYQFNTGRVDWTHSFVLPQGWFITAHRPDRDKAELFLGDGVTSITAWRATFRNPACYPATDRVNTDPSGCALLEAENTNGLTQVWQFTVLNGNLGRCENEPPANVEGNLAANRTSATPTSCPQFAGQTTTGGNDGAPYCRYAGAVLTGTVPVGYNAQYWDGSAVQQAQSGAEITAGEATFRRNP